MSARNHIPLPSVRAATVAARVERITAMPDEAAVEAQSAMEMDDFNERHAGFVKNPALVESFGIVGVLAGVSPDSGYRIAMAGAAEFASALEEELYRRAEEVKSAGASVCYTDEDLQVLLGYYNPVIQALAAEVLGWRRAQTS